MGFILQVNPALYIAEERYSPFKTNDFLDIVYLNDKINNYEKITINNIYFLFEF